MSKKETKKQYWQRMAKGLNVKFQENDTIDMLVTAIAAKLKIDSDGISPSGLQKMVNKALADKDAEKTNKKGKSWSKTKGSRKPEAGSGKSEDGSEKAEVVEPEEKENNNTKAEVESEKPEVGSGKTEVGSGKTEVGSEKAEVVEGKTEEDLEPATLIELPNFKNVADMKIFCVHTGLNLLDGYVLASRFKQVAFLEWIKEHASQATNIETFVLPSSLKKDGISAAKELIPGFDAAPKTPVVDAEVSPAMRDYANCIKDFILKAPSVTMHGHFPQKELDDMIAKALKVYTYHVESDEFGKFINMKNSKGAVCRIPESGYLPL